ncbi:hypothetical protein U9M48_001868 [Paspalum notatum var. saurae]|uniref:Uncharacterized protein n=1 Tax=Paspalum notatum var. saurae TaxID=547442 RepID=A0AAQ3PIQ0_PASNO
MTTAAAGAASDTSDSKSSDSESSDDSSKSSKKHWEHFEDFAVNLMLRSDMALLESFRLDIGKGRGTHRQCQAWGWLRRAIKFSTPAPADRPSSTRSFSSWNLKRLHLCNVLLEKLFAKHVSSVCRALQVILSATHWLSDWVILQ